MIIPSALESTRIQRSTWPLSSAMPPLGALTSAPGSARAHLAVVLAGWRLSGLADDGETVISELVTNAVRASTLPSGEPRYTGGRMAVIRMHLLSDGTRLLAEIYDQAPGVPALQNAAPDSETGRGLVMVSHLAEQWGWHPLAGQAGKCVWAVLS